MRTVIIGLGNPVRTDDAVGLAVARLLRVRLAGLEGYDVTELGAGGLRVAEAMTGYDRAVIIDALSTGTNLPGTVSRLELGDLGGAHNMNCVHDASLATALEMWRRAGAPMPDDIRIWGIEAQDLEHFGEELTTSVAGAVPLVAQAIMDELRPLQGV